MQFSSRADLINPSTGENVLKQVRERNNFNAHYYSKIPAALVWFHAFMKTDFIVLRNDMQRKPWTLFGFLGFMFIIIIVLLFLGDLHTPVYEINATFLIYIM